MSGIKLRITVTKEMLEQPRYNFDCSRCVIAQSLKFIFPMVEVSPFLGIYPFGFYKGALIINIPEEVSFYAYNYDGNQPLEPCSFDIEIPDSVISQINIDELKPLLENHPTLALV